MRSLVDIV